jgi:hypothetical protein
VQPNLRKLPTQDRDGLRVPMDENNLADQVTWVHSYVSLDKKKTFCVYDGPSPEAIRRTAHRAKLPMSEASRLVVVVAVAMPSSCT